MRGMTWDHPRGYEPLLACSLEWERRTGVAVEWDRHSLQDFEAYPTADLARRYDLIVVDHPHVGQAAAQGCLAAFDGPTSPRDASVGPSAASYVWRGRAFARPIDAACQVSAWVATVGDDAPRTWADVEALARKRLVAWPLKPPHAFLSFCTLVAGKVARNPSEGLFDPDGGERALDAMRKVAALLDPRMHEMDPIDVLEQMGGGASGVVFAPVVFGYVSYAQPGFRTRRIKFGDLPARPDGGHGGSVLGGTGIAVSALGDRREQATLFANWLASAEAQLLAGLAGGQPASSAAWEDAELNTASGDFYAGTRRTIEASWVRPRHAGFIGFQYVASLTVGAALRGEVTSRDAVRTLNAAFSASLEA